jgi:RNA polymerase sigma-70 factor (ECF subfamily)
VQLALSRGATATPHELESAYQTHHTMVYRTAYRVTGNSADAEDVLQTVFLRLMKHDGGSAPVEQPEGYLRRAAVNASIDLLRERQRTGQAVLESLPASPVCTELRELRDALRGAIAKLEGRQAEMVALRFFEGHSNKEIAQMFGISQILVAVTLHRAKSKLQKELEAYRDGGRK